MGLTPSQRTPRASTSAPPLAKSALDRSVAVLLLLLSSLWLALIALAIWLEDDGPLLTRESRVGQRGRSFDLLRFRTSRWVGTADGAWPGPPMQRASTVGRLLRRYHLDDLPRLINVAKGDLSLIGPRARSTTDPRAFLHPAVRPGLIAPWDNRTAPRTAADEVRAVQVYVGQWSAWRDLTLTWRALRR